MSTPETAFTLDRMAKDLKIPLEIILEYLRDFHLTDFHKDTLFEEEDYRSLLKAFRRKYERHQMPITDST